MSGISSNDAQLNGAICSHIINGGRGRALGIAGLTTIVKVILEGNFALILAVLTPPAASISVPNKKMVMANPPHA